MIGATFSLVHERRRCVLTLFISICVRVCVFVPDPVIIAALLPDAEVLIMSCSGCTDLVITAHNVCLYFIRQNLPYIAFFFINPLTLIFVPALSYPQSVLRLSSSVSYLFLFSFHC